MTFAEYLEDILDLQAGLMSEEEFDRARKNFEQFLTPKKSPEAHPDMKKSIAELRARCERLVAGQEKAIARVAEKSEYSLGVIDARAAVAEGTRILAAKRPTKAEFIAHAEQNSDASRQMNAMTPFSPSRHRP